MRDKQKYIEAANRKWKDPQFREKQLKNNPWRRFYFGRHPRLLSPSLVIKDEER